MSDLLKQDAENRLRALALASFIVEAPAGAGKTELLTQRYMKLLSVVHEPEEIVALTFTNKATAEMRQRILQSLQDAANHTPVEADKPHKQQTRTLALDALKRDQARGWQLLAQPARLRIQTIDALCGSLTQQMPLLSRFGGQPALADDASPYYREAAQRTLADVAEESSADGPISTVLAFMQNQAEKLTELLADMLAKRDQWLLPLAGHTDEAEIARQTHAIVTQETNTALQAALHAVPDAYQTKLMSTLRYAADNAPSAFDLSELRDWQTPLGARPDGLSGWLTLCDFLLTDKGQFRSSKSLNVNYGFPKDDPKKTENLENFTEVCTLIGDPAPLAALRELPHVNANEITQNAKLAAAFAQVLKLAAAHLWTVFQAANVVDFVQVTQSAIQALENTDGPTDLALRLDYQISHLLVDEFQDTSPTQIALLKALTQGWEDGGDRTLFCVGDPMQSIYRFRKADVGEFLNASKFGIGHIRLEPLKLSLNNRSRPEVLQWINDSFVRIFPTQDTSASAAIAYRKCEPKLDPAQDAGVQIHALVVSNDDESQAARTHEAHHIANLIAQEQREKPGQSIAVLVRSRAHLHHLVSVMRREFAHIPFQALEIEALNERQTVLDALSLTRAMLHLADRVHWLAILRAPWCGLTLADLHTLCADNHHATIWQLMQDEARLQRMSEEGQARLNLVRTILARAFAEQGRMPLRRWLETTWLQLGGGSALLNAGDIRDVQAFFDLLEENVIGDGLDFAQMDAAMEQLYAKPDASANERLQFITMHAAKGLEFDCVILPALNAKTRNDNQPLIMWQEFEVQNHLQLLMAPIRKANKHAGIGLYDYLYKLEQQRNRNETARLLYVAATRAKRRLHLVGTIAETAKNERKPQSTSLLAQLWPCVQDHFLNAVKLAPNIPNSSEISSFSSQLQRLSMKDLAQIATEMNAPAHLDFPPPTEVTGAAPDIARDMGTLAHQYMEMLAKQRIDSNKLAQSEPAMQHWLQQQGYGAHQSNTAASQVLSALQATLKSADGQWVLQYRENAQSEYALISEDDAQHVIDHTFIENGTRWIVDYKLGLDVTEQNAKAVALTHLPQLERYARLFSNENLPIKKAVLFLNIGLLIPL